MQSAPAESDNFYVFRVAHRPVGRSVRPSVRSRQNVEFPLGDKEPFATSASFFPPTLRRSVCPALPDTFNDDTTLTRYLIDLYTRTHGRICRQLVSE